MSPVEKLCNYINAQNHAGLILETFKPQKTHFEEKLWAERLVAFI